MIFSSGFVVTCDFWDNMVTVCPSNFLYSYHRMEI